MTAPTPRPPDEAERIAALRRYQILDTAPEPEFDGLARLAGILWDVPIALVSFVDEERQWSKARVGLDTAECPRDVAFCAHAIVDSHRPFVVEDAARDPRFARNPLVTREPAVRFYAGAPLVTPEGHVVGTLCVMDLVPHEPTPAQLEALSILARQVVAQLELRQRAEDLSRTVHEQSQSLELADMAIETQELLRAAFEDAAVGIALVALDGRWLRVNDALCRIVGYSRSELLSMTLQGITHPDELQQDAAEMSRLLKGDALRYGRDKRCLHKDGHVVWARVDVSVLRDAASRPLHFIAQIQDVSTAHQAVDALRDSEARYRLLFDATPYPAWVYDLQDLRLLAVNEATARHYGYARGEMLRMTLRDLVPAEDLPHFAVHLRAGGAGAGPWTWRHRRKDGSLMDVETTSGALVFAGRPAGLCLNNDVTARLKAERRQAAQHAVTHALVESPSLDDAMPKILRSLCQTLLYDFAEFWVVDRDNAALESVATYRAGPLLQAFELTARQLSFTKGTGVPGRIWASGEPLWIVDLSQDHSSVHAAAAAEAGLRSGFGVPVMLTGEVQGVMVFFSRKAEPRDDDLLALFNTIGSQVSQFIERDAADRAFRASEARTSSVIENMLEGLIVVDTRAVIESVNPAAERMFGYTRWDLVGQHLKVLMPQSVAANADAFLKDAFRRAIGQITEWDGRRKNGEIFRFELSLYEFLTDDGRHFAGHVRDISDRRKLERMKKEFVATVSHELRTPLTSIRGSLSLLAGGALGELSDEASDVIAIAERNTIRLISLINDILDLERLDAGKMDLHIVQTPISQIVTSSIDAVRGMADGQAVSLEFDASTDPVLCDPDRLVQVLVNLLSNAVKFSPHGGVVRVEVRREGPAVEVRVKDQGRGIPASHHEAIFQRFQQVAASDSRQKGGTGLGLAIARAIVEQHGGSIGVESEPGKGSTFWFRVPLAGLDAPHDRLLASIAGQNAGEGVSEALLADYDEAFLGVVARQFLQHGVAVRFATSVPEALRLIHERRPGVLVLDFGLPTGDGKALVRAMQADDTLKDVPLLVYTAHDLTNEDKAELVLGPTRHLTKGRCDDDAFWEQVAQLLEASPRSEPTP